MHIPDEALKYAVDKLLITYLFTIAPKPETFTRFGPDAPVYPDFSMDDARDLKRQHHPTLQGVTPSQIVAHVAPNELTMFRTKPAELNQAQLDILDPIRIRIAYEREQAKKAQKAFDIKKEREVENLKLNWAYNTLRKIDDYVTKCER
jgi:hypothetical protein